MALGFIKKIFSFGKKEVDEVPAEIPVPALEAPVQPTTEQVYEDTTAQEALPVPAEAEPVEAELVEPVPVRGQGSRRRRTRASLRSSRNRYPLQSCRNRSRPNPNRS